MRTLPRMEAELESALLDYDHSRDAQLLAVAISQLISAGHAGGVASILIQPQHKEIVQQVSWELLACLPHHLPPSSSPEWELITLIAETCPPKEMCLAFLEQLELAAHTSPHTTFQLLAPLTVVLQRLGPGGSQLVSTLIGVQHIVGRLFPSLEEEEVEEKKGKTMEEEGEKEEEEEQEKEEEEEGEKEDEEEQEKEEEEEQEKEEEEQQEKEEEEEQEKEEEEQQEKEEEDENVFISVSLAASQVVNLILLTVDTIHQQYITNEAPMLTFWTPLQRVCLSILLTLLDQPMVTFDLRRESISPNLKAAAETIMDVLVQCHCGCLQLLEWEGEKWRRYRKEEEEEDDDEAPLSMVGVACFAYLLLCEGLHSSYLPSPIHPHHLLHITLTHITTLLARAEKYCILKGLALLKKVLSRVSPHSLCHELLETNKTFKTTEALVKVMVTCSYKTLRQKSVSLLPQLIQRFSSTGRYKIYRYLLHTTSHAGVHGLLIHSVKNEVDKALTSPAPSPFLGSGLAALLRKTLTLSTDQSLLQEVDRVMASLNFLRYLLIKDSLDSNRSTGVWGEVDRVRSKFIEPLRTSLERTRLDCRAEEERISKEMSTAEETPQVKVQVMGAQLPDISPQEEQRILQLARHQLDMIECVLIRVEELLEDNTAS